MLTSAAGSGMAASRPLRRVDLRVFVGIESRNPDFRRPGREAHVVALLVEADAAVRQGLQDGAQRPHGNRGGPRLRRPGIQFDLAPQRQVGGRQPHTTEAG